MEKLFFKEIHYDNGKYRYFFNNKRVGKSRFDELKSLSGKLCFNMRRDSYKNIYIWYN